MTGKQRAVMSVRRVMKRFGGLVAVNNVSFEVRDGEILAIIGPNGSGKTTMMNLISGALRLTEGQITLRGEFISGLPANKICELGISRTFQLVRVLPGLSCLENCLAGMVFGRRKLWGAAAEYEAGRLLEKVGLADRINVPVPALTYIDQKRLELARALASEPEVLLLDEWLAGLNRSELVEGIDLVRALNRDGTTIILVEHVMDAVRSLCDRCVVMAAGSKIAEGSPNDVLSDPEVVRVYLGEDV